MGKVIYQPKGAAREYARWACNLYNGCPHGCSYCYCKRGVLGHVMGNDIPVLKKSAGLDDRVAYSIFCKELDKYKDRIKAEGESLFFSFSTDPMVKQEFKLTTRCIGYCVFNDIPVQILTKATWFRWEPSIMRQFELWKNYLTIGVTLTGHDEMEPGASSNAERIMLLRNLLNDCGVNTFISLEPIVDFKSSLEMMKQSLQWTAEYRIGLMSGINKEEYYNPVMCQWFIDQVLVWKEKYHLNVIWKNSIKEYGRNHDIAYSREDRKEKL